MGRRRYAAVDIGTNSTRLLIADVDAGKVSPRLAALRMSRVGEGMAKGGGLSPEGVARTLRVLREYRGLLEEHGVEAWRVVATSAVREAANGDEFVARVLEETGLRVDVISGEEEAYLSYIGACSALPGAEEAVVVDIGGGSTEFTYSRGECGGDPLVCRSIPVGAVRLKEKPLLLDGILEPLRATLDELRGLRKPLVGVGGTVTTLAAVDQMLETYDWRRVHGYRLERDAVERILFLLAAKTTEERKGVPGLQPERADIIVAGTTILWAILGYLGAPDITVSEADILYGIILELSRE